MKFQVLDLQSSNLNVCFINILFRNECKLCFENLKNVISSDISSDIA